MKEELLRFNKDQKYMVFDYETCSLNLVSNENKPWQLAYIVFQGDKILEEKDYLLKWDDLKVSKEAARITGFSMSKYNKNKVCPKGVMKEFSALLQDESIIPLGHNVLGFDVYIYNIHRRLCGLEPDYSFCERIIDTVCLARAVKKNIKKPKRESMLPWQYRLLNFREKGLRVSLQQCCKDYEVDFDPKKLHDALYDIRKNMDIFNKIIWQTEV
jgi:DNA polymerase III epsilon subunit-like protein